MNSNIKDLSGEKFGLLTVLSEHERRNNYVYWKCQCECGQTVWVRGTNLSYGTTKSCGNHTRYNVIHGQTNSRLYRIFHTMRQRCNNSKAAGYQYYGGRGIKVCAEWNSADGFARFYEWSMANGYKDDLTIDRKDVDGDYCPENCRWVTDDVQHRNMRSNRFIDTEIATDFAARNNLPPKTVIGRLDQNWNPEHMGDSTPKARMVFFEGKYLTLEELSKKTGININTLSSRYQKGYSDEDIVKPYRFASKRPVCQYTKDGIFVAKYDSARDASIETGVRFNNITMCCRGQRKSSGGYIWKYASDFKPIEKKDRVLHRVEGGGWIDERGKVL